MHEILRVVRDKTDYVLWAIYITVSLPLVHIVYE
jgi:hypothetical protein